MLSSKVASSPKLLARSAASPRVLLAKPLPSRSVLVRFKEDERDGDNVLSKVQDKAKQQVEKLKDNLPDTGSAKDYTNRKIEEGQNVLRSGTSFDSQVKTNVAVSAFTRRREVFAGRMAMLGFFAACFWEWYFPSRPNILQQLTAISGQTGFDITEATWLTAIIGLIAYNAITAFSPVSSTWTDENQHDVAKRPRGPNDSSPESVQGYLGVRGMGFNKANELFVGRTAMMGFLAAIVGQLWQGGLQGPGPIAQVANYLGAAPTDAFYASAGNGFLLSVVAILIIATIRGQFGTTQGEEDIY